jgi:hypothetical protein
MAVNELRYVPAALSSKREKTWHKMPIPADVLKKGKVLALVGSLPDFWTKIFHVFFISPISITCPVRLTIFYLIIVILSVEEKSMKFLSKNITSI